MDLDKINNNDCTYIQHPNGVLEGESLIAKPKDGSNLDKTSEPSSSYVYEKKD